jgi:hypothetical protein
MTLVEYITIGIYILVYGIVFFIQKSQFDKQKSIMEKYEKMFSIINIDEIEKYVNLKEKGLKLDFENREKEIKINENIISKNLDRAEDLINGLDDMKLKLKEVNEIKDEANLTLEKTNNYIDNRIKIDAEIQKFYEEEFNEIYDFINNDLKSIDEFKGLFFENNLLAIRNEYILKRTELLKNREKLN